MLAKLTGWLLLGIVRLLTGAQARWYGCPPKAEQRIYFANHQSHADLVMIWAALPEELRSITRPIAARDYWANTPVKRWITTEVFNAVYVERAATTPPAPAPSVEVPQPSAVEPAPHAERIEPSMEPLLPMSLPFADTSVEVMNEVQGQLDLPPPAPPPQPSAPEPSPAAAQPEPTPAPPAADPLAPLIEALRSGDSIIIFPEGTRGHTGEPQKFKSGLYALATMFPEVVLVPAWIDNVQRVMPKGEIVPVPILCSVTFGAPIRVEEGEERRPFLDRARAAVIALRDV
ncbi:MULTISPECIES: lysophospholipid acyltransferase family protein [Variovorax]|jgi:1-acyl-sn-glycerol-3-phosphate acyltransferase|uniref:lysophospholipid acyltransferase family protein n=1 Tax=Variovorax TaxID=34072 RepID=UPI00086ABF04|nr:MULTISPECIES: lysophospholipid acyltransferase family protein [Variovorax]MBN8756145.1 1-acyl-sn-glycerol-3-phosphate acyltransferase [Variovorax sp.]ODU16583.1 MAG: glycerol acyltransferase [Variovorax sp. SCN 67-85]ODV23699.1 MAG: glycerol acyltransferase [Variovorax sp. SCN 67-20]OJZ13062.1 MAG: 1-acyl-sn-glycerol-3-phosphate acyltransferase [Variovorax sp. 67-131]UKI09658.1 1-acyl-sn-glycerol-3-phosphate acyltransferase [Variovorax paradoxus]